jgi:hypothetical protein
MPDQLTVSLFKYELPPKESREQFSNFPRGSRLVSDNLEISQSDAKNMFIVSIFRINEKREAMEYFLKPVEGAKLSWGVSGNENHAVFDKRFKVFTSHENAEDFLISIQRSKNDDEGQIGHIYQAVHIDPNLWLSFIVGFALSREGLRVTRAYYNHFDNNWEQLNPIEISKYLSVG